MLIIIILYRPYRLLPRLGYEAIYVLLAIYTSLIVRGLVMQYTQCCGIGVWLINKTVGGELVRLVQVVVLK